MFNSLIGNVLNWGAGVMDFLFTWIFRMLTFNLSFFTTNFPVIGTMYTILQGVAIGLVVGLGAFQLLKFFTGPLNSSRSTPMEIGVRMALAFAMIWFGNYFLEAIVNLFTYPYQALLGVDASAMSQSVMQDTSALLTGLIDGAAGTVLSIIMTFMLGWNLLKLFLEVVERYLMVGVLTYTSPLAWATLSTQESTSIFKKWLSMFFGQCLLMLLNVWSVKMIISVMTFTGSNILFRMILGLAFCKVAQRFDTYLQTIGVNAAHTGGSLADDVMAVGASMLGLGSKTTGALAMGAGNNALGNSLIKGGWKGGLAYTIGTHFANRGAREAAENIPNTPHGQESTIFRNADGGYSWQDKNGNLWNANNYRQAEGIRAAVQKGYAQYEGESGISRDDRGNYVWTDANGEEHKSNSMTGILSQQAAARAAYGAGVKPLRNDEDIIRGDDGRFYWTDRNGNQYSAESFEAMKAQKDAVVGSYENVGKESDIKQRPDGSYEWTDKYGNVHTAESLEQMEQKRAQIRSNYTEQKNNNTGNDSVSNTKKVDMSAYASQLFDKAGNPKPGVTSFDEQGREVIASKSDRDAATKIAAISNPAAMKTAAGEDNISAIKAATITSRGVGTAQALMRTGMDGGITDERVIGATYEQLFGGAGENNIDKAIPGLSNAMSSANGEYIDGSGDVCDLNMNNGEMKGTYTPIDSNGNEGEASEFSIRTAESYAKLPEAEKNGYVAFEGADGSTYYASGGSVEVKDEPVTTAQTGVPTGASSGMSNPTDNTSGISSYGGSSGAGSPSAPSNTPSSENPSVPGSAPMSEGDSTKGGKPISEGSSRPSSSSEKSSGVASFGGATASEETQSVSQSDKSPSPYQPANTVELQDEPSHTPLSGTGMGAHNSPIEPARGAIENNTPVETRSQNNPAPSASVTPNIPATGREPGNNTTPSQTGGYITRKGRSTVEAYPTKNTRNKGNTGNKGKKK